jgi:penicillin-binding protein 1A
MPGAAGGSLAAPIFAQMIGRYYVGRTPTATWTAPGGVVTAELDRQTGMVADSLTPPERRYTEYFIQGTEPGARPLDPWSIFRWGPIAF